MSGHHPRTPRSPLVVRAFYGTQALLLLAALIAQCILTHREGRSLANTFSYFTIQSNVLVLITASVLAVRPTVAGPAWRLVRLAALVGITVTGIVYEIVLARYVHLTGWAAVYNVVFHYIMPISTVAAFFLVEPRLGLTRRGFWFAAWPVAWLVYTMVRGLVFKPKFNEFNESNTPPSDFPYPFLDITRIGVWPWLGAVAIVTTLILLVGWAYIRLDERFSRSNR